MSNEIHFKPVNLTRKEFIDLGKKTGLSNHYWITPFHGIFLSYVLTIFWNQDNVIMLPDDRWKELKDYKDVTEKAITFFNCFLKPEDYKYKIKLDNGGF